MVMRILIASSNPMTILGHLLTAVAPVHTAKNTEYKCHILSLGVLCLVRSRKQKVEHLLGRPESGWTERDACYTLQDHIHDEFDTMASRYSNRPICDLLREYSCILYVSEPAVFLSQFWARSPRTCHGLCSNV